MKVLEEITSEDKFLEDEEAQDSSKRDNAAFDNSLELSIISKRQLSGN